MTFVAEFTSLDYDPRVRSTARLVTCTKVADGVQVRIEAERAAAMEGSFVTLSNEFIPTAAWPTVRAALMASPSFKLRKVMRDK